MATFPVKCVVRAAAVLLLCLPAGDLAARAAAPPGVRADLPRDTATLDSGRDLIAGAIVEVSPPALDGRRRLLLDVSQVFQGTLWRGRHTVQWIPPTRASPVPPAGTRIVAFVDRGKDGTIAVLADDIYEDNPGNRAIASARYVRIGRNDRSLEFLLVASAVALGLAALFALRQRRRAIKPGQR